ncbi:peptidoglycan-binding domain-containing protein [Spirillospora sp. NPDC047279]|uniref:peptidoglycan-binding domain-containing protein n=1 Tax=Spirillospora sp. NPDC047279 TaxID=3155478 RepID=UPI0033FF4747
MRTVPEDPLPGGRRRPALAGLVAGAVMVSLAGSGASTLVKSPQQVAAEAEPPEPSVISAPVERRVLRETVVLRGTVTPGKTIKVAAPTFSEVKAVITRSPVKRGQRVGAGAVVAEVSGRPVIALRGRIPAYRDVEQGTKGPDVRQLNAALRDLGYRVGGSSEVFGASTAAAVKRLYADRGYDAPVEEVQPPPAEETPSSSRDKEQEKEPPKQEKRAYLSAGEVLFLPAFPARVAAVKARLGDPARETILELSADDLVARGSLSAADHELVETGMRVTILAEETGLEATGKVTSIGEFAGGGGTGGGSAGGPAEDGTGQAAALPGHPIVVKGMRPLSQRFEGRDVRLTIEAASTGGPVLVVPTSAIHASADGSNQVIKLMAGERRQRIPVRTGASGGGFVEVVPSGPGRLAPDDRVVVGK